MDQTRASFFLKPEFFHNKQRHVIVPETVQGPALRAARLDKGHEILLDALGFEPPSVDSLVERTGLPIQSVTSMLLNLELEGAIGSHAGGATHACEALAQETERTVEPIR